MITRPKLAEIGQWYTRRDEGEVFQVAGYDDRSQTIEIQSFDGDIRAQVPFDLVRQAGRKLFHGHTTRAETGEYRCGIR